MTLAQELRLLNDFQRAFPTCEAPYAEIASSLGTTQDWVLATLRRWINEARVRRVGATFAPTTATATTLAAMTVPASRLAVVSRNLAARRGVVDIIGREHRFNLWFTLAASDVPALDAIVHDIARTAVLSVISVPLLREYRSALDDDLDAALGAKAARGQAAAPAGSMPDSDSVRIVAALQDGLPLVARPYASIAERAGLRYEGRERVVRDLIRRWLDDGFIERLGLIVSHRYSDAAVQVMAVWDVPDEEVDIRGRMLAREQGVMRCCRRSRALHAWPYNLFCEFHGADRRRIDASIDAIAARTGLQRHAHARLFSPSEHPRHRELRADSEVG